MQQYLIKNRNNQFYQTIEENYQACWVFQESSQTLITHEFVINHDAKIEIKLHLDSFASVCYIPIFLGTGTAQITINCFLNQSSNLIINGAYSLYDSALFDFNTMQTHNHPQATSTVIINGLVHNQAKVSYKGLIAIEEAALGTNAMLENKTILSDAGTQAISIPSLEIKTNEVSCAHASAIGKLSQEQIWYTMARGLDFYAAKQLLLSSFLMQTLSYVSDFTLKEQLVKKLLIRK